MTQTDTLVRLLVIVLAVIVLLPLLGMTMMLPMMGLWGWGHMGGAGMWDGGAGSWLWLVLWVVPLLLVAGGGFLVSRSLQRADDAPDAAIQELRSAYARGDLSDEEFERRRERLRRSE